MSSGIVWGYSGWWWLYGQSKPIPTAQSLIVAPENEPIEVETVKKQRRVTTTTLDDLFAIWIGAARQHFEEQTGRQCVTATWEYWLAGFPARGVIEIPHPPLQDVESVVYDDSDGTEHALDTDSYTVEKPSGPYAPPGRVVLKPGVSWPTTVADRRFSVRVRYVAGYGDDEDAMPPIVKAALMFLIGDYHKFAEGTQDFRGTMQTMPTGAEKMMEAFKYSALPVHPPVR